MSPSGVCTTFTSSSIVRPNLQTKHFLAQICNNTQLSTVSCCHLVPIQNIGLEMPLVGSMTLWSCAKVAMLLALIVQGRCAFSSKLRFLPRFSFNCEISWSFVCEGCLTAHWPFLYDFKNTWRSAGKLFDSQCCRNEVFPLAAVIFLWMNLYLKHQKEILQEL